MPRLQPVAPDLWVAQYPLRLLGLNLGRQTAIVRLPDDQGLVLISPGPVDDEVQHELARIGTVRHIVAPSCSHDTFIPENLRAYPGAAFHASPGFEKVLKVDRRIRVLGSDEPESWDGIFDLHLISGMPKVNEVVFNHLSSGSLIVADLVFNLPPHVDLWTRLFMTLNGAYPGVRASRLYKAFIRDRNAQRQSIAALLRQDFGRLIPAHGLVVGAGAKRALQVAWEL